MREHRLWSWLVAISLLSCGGSDSADGSLAAGNLPDGGFDAGFGGDDDTADDDALASDDSTGSDDDTATSGDDDTAAMDDDTAAMDDDTSAMDDDTSAMDDDTAAADDDTAAMDDDPATADDDIAMGDDAGTVAPPDASVPCTQDSECDNGLYCDGQETCDSGYCAPGTEVQCDDGVDCTEDVCVEDTRSCDYLPKDSACSDGQFCNGREVCDPTAGCQPGVPPACVDSVDCTVDSCDEVNDRCVFAPDSTLCDDGTFCNGAETCDPGAGCVSGRPPDCNDQIACTTDSCDEDAKACANVPDDMACSNGIFCDGDEVCTPGVGCEAGTAVACANEDGIACTVESCDEATQQCISTPSSDECPTGQFCTDGVGCEQGDPCDTQADCDDLNPCNGVEQCQTDPIDSNLKFCVPGTAVDCDDSIDCTADACDPGTGDCSHTPQDGACSDNDLCNGSEVCDAAQGCVAGTPLDCSDGVGCTDDTVCSPTGGCLNPPVDSRCRDNLVCNGEEYCDPVLDCQPGTPVVCPSDGVDCTVDECDEAAGGCAHTPDDSVCAPTTCTPGAKVPTCDAALGCGNYCEPATCQGKVYLCGDCKDNDGDCLADDKDPECFGACDNNESGWKGEIPGQNQNPCNKMDCYFDQDSGSGNDDCNWSHGCDPLEPTLNCSYNANTNVPGTQASCSDLQASQTQACTNFCEPLTPNGCDCFGCCDVYKGGTKYTVYLGSEDAGGNGTCNLAVADQPDKCHSCTQVAGCLNTCENCELCLGKDTLPPECGGSQTCLYGAPCGQPGQAECSGQTFCLTGCCAGF